MSNPQLKKSNFLDSFKDEDGNVMDPMTRGEIVDNLEEYEFIDSWLSFLLESYVESGKLAETTDDDGETRYQLIRKGGGSSGPRTAFRIVVVGEEYTLETMEVSGTEPLDKDAGWAGSINAAAKRARQIVFGEYKARVEAINTCRDAASEVSEDSESEETDEAA